MRVHTIEKGRYIFWPGKSWSDPAVRLELSNSYNFGLGFNIKREERDLQFSFYCWRLFSVWLTFETKRLDYKSDPIDSGIVWQSKEHVINIKFLDQTGMDSSKPAVIHIYWNYRDWLLGRSIYSESQHGSSYHIKTLKMQMPEGEYEMKLDRYTGYWHRPRSPFVRSIERVEVTPTVPVGVPGKGENSWDLDEDATFSSTMPVNGRTDEEIVEDFKQDILKTRERHGGKNWVPERDWSEAAQ